MLVTDDDNHQQCHQQSSYVNQNNCSSNLILPYVVDQLGFHEVLLLEMNPVLCMRSVMVLFAHLSVHHFGFLFEVYLLLVEFLLLLLVQSSHWDFRLGGVDFEMVDLVSEA